MSIVFFENFEQDTRETLPLRYPGSRQTILGTDIGGFPLIRASTNTSTANDALLAGLPTVSPDTKKLDVVMTFDDNGDTSGISPNSRLCIYGTIFIGATNDTTFAVYPSASGAALYTITVPSVKAIEVVQVIADIQNQTITVIIDSEPYLSQEPAAITLGTANEIRVSATGTARQPLLPNFIKSIVVATDLPAGQMIDPKTIQFFKSELTATEVSTWQYSDSGYSEDVDKADPLVTEPSVYTETEGEITYTASEVPDTLATSVYAAGRSDLKRYVQLGGSGGPVNLMGTDVYVFPRYANNSPVIKVSASKLPPEISNGLGIEWG